MSSDFRDDEELIAAIQRKDVGALEAFYDRHRVLAYSLAVRLLGNGPDAEDVVQEAFLNVWRGAATFRSERGGARSWLLSVVHHRAIDKLRGWQSRPRPVELDDDLTVPAHSDVWREVMEHLRGEEVRSALAQLPTEQRETIELAYFQGKTHVEIAERMGVPLGTVKGRMRLGLLKLKSLLQSSHEGAALE